MQQRFVTIWFRFLKTDRFSIRRPELRNLPFVLAAPDHGRMVITEANMVARQQGIQQGMVVADARAILPSIQVIDDPPGLSNQLLTAIAEWCIRFSPIVALDLPDGLIIDATGCAHLWGGERTYLQEIIQRLNTRGYHVRASISDTIGSAWAITRFGKNSTIIPPAKHHQALLTMPPDSLRIDSHVSDRLHKLGLKQVQQFASMPRSALRRRFGMEFLQRLDQALGHADEIITPVHATEMFHEWLPSIEPIVTATGIEIALQELLEKLCARLLKEQKGLRCCILKCYRTDGKIEMIDISTNRASNNTKHLYKLFEHKIATIEPSDGIELFILEAPKIEEAIPVQEELWNGACGLDDTRLSELLDRLESKIGKGHVHRFLPDEHYWPERSIKKSLSLQEKQTTEWRNEHPRPIQLLCTPQLIEVTAPIPDYPPMLFRYKGKIHKIIKADGPERIEQEWWLSQGQHRDYYYVEDEEGCRYWLFRLGHYSDTHYQWFLHGFFA